MATAACRATYVNGWPAAGNRKIEQNALASGLGRGAKSGVTTRPSRPSRADTVARIVEACLIAVVRTPKPEHVIPACEALVAGGIKAVEVTLTVPGAVQLIGQARATFPPDVLVGAGTVLNMEALRSSIKAGAEFVVTPVLRLGLISAAHDLDTPIMLGAYSPTEIWNAHEAGADFVKVFPADTLGASYIRSIRAPMPALRIVPTGGVNLDTIPELVKAGCVALGVGSSLLTREILTAEDWPKLADLTRRFVEAVSKARQV